LIDDGNGNIIDLDNSNEHVGNILYAQGMVVITNATYVPVFTPIYSNFNFYINNIVNVSGSITGSSDVRMDGYIPFRVDGAPGTNLILPGFNAYDLDYAAGNFPTKIEFDSLENSNTSSFGAPKVGVVIFDNVNPIGTDPFQRTQYAWDTVDSSYIITEPIFLPTNTGATPTLEVALVPIVRQCLSVVFNHFDTTLNPGARVVIYDEADPSPSGVFFDKTIAEIVSDNTYAYLIQTPRYRGQLIVTDISDVTRPDGSSSIVRVFSKVAVDTGRPIVKYRISPRNVVFDFQWFDPIYPIVNIQLEYAS
jgi:hypothetical protein